jgi:PKD repeat protein
MKKKLLAYLLLIANYSLLPAVSSAQQGEWTWMKGSNSAGASASYGTQGVETPTSTPPGLYASTGWTDHQHKFWLFGGYEITGEAHSALWKFDPSTNNWTWMKGPNTVNAYGSYGTQGIPDPANYPGARWLGFPKWVDTSGNIWLFGGYGYGANSNGSLADLWKYDIATNEWTFIKGYNTPGHLPTYGVQGIPNPNNQPGSRGETTCSWTDSQNHLWFYGGTTDAGDCGDLWMYNITTNEWTWMAGDNFAGTMPSYGTQGVFSPTNEPGSRQVYCNWIDSADHLWLFGGGYPTRYGDLWEFDMSINQWAWISGSNIPNYTGPHGPKCTAGNYHPNSRSENRIEWIDACENLWLFGGGDSYGDPTYNDLWQFIPTLNKWVYVSGDSIDDPLSNYGTIGVSSPTNKPGGRESSSSWVDAQGNLWFFGGSYGSWNTQYNDMWRYVPDTSCFGCNQDLSLLLPTAMFISNDSSACTGECLSFTDQSLNDPTSWQWSFPGGSPSSSLQQNPANICYANPGLYDVTLIASTTYGSDTLTQTGYIIIFTPLTVSIVQNGNTLFCDPAASSYQWLLNGNLIPDSIFQTLFITQTGTYTVDAIDSNGCSSSATIIITSLPSPGFTASDLLICEKFCVSFSDQSTNNPTAWQWIFPGGAPSTSSDQNPPNICYNNPGTFDVTLITTNANGTDTLILPGYITVYSTPLLPSISQTGYTLTSSAAATYQWQFNSADIPGATNQTYEVLQSGLYTVFITDENGCSSSATVNVLITGINDVPAHEDVLIYPNPSDGSFIVELSNCQIDDEVKIRIHNTLGQVVFSSQEKISFSDWKIEIDLCRNAIHCVSEGIYHIEISVKNSPDKGDVLIRKKIIITK